MKNLKKPTAGILLATMIFSNAKSINIYANNESSVEQIKIEENVEVKEEDKSLEVNEESEIVNIPDDNLKKAIYDNLNKDESEDITRRELQQVQELHINNIEINNLEGIQYCTNLSYLGLFHCNLTDITIIGELSNLQSLELLGNEIVDISPVGKLRNLNALTLDYNRIRDIEQIANLNNLIHLSLSNNEITNIQSIPEKENLQLNLENNYIDISEGSNSKNKIDRLISLGNNVTYSPQIEVGPMKLKPINPDTNPAEDNWLSRKVAIEVNKPIEQLTQRDFDEITSVNMDGENINSIPDQIGNLQNLVVLIMREPGDIIDIPEEIANIERLTHVTLSNQKISNINPLKNVTSLKYLELMGNNITDITPLNNLYNIEGINLRGNNISDISNLSVLPGMKLDISENYLDITENSESMKKIQEIKNNGGTVTYEPQRNPVVGDPNEIVNIPDSEFRKILMAHGVDENRDGKITAGEMAELTKIDRVYHAEGVEDISGIEYAINLRELKLPYSNIDNIDGINNLNQLKILEIGGNTSTDISPIYSLDNIESLHLAGFKFTDLNKLNELEKLTSLGIAECSVEDISPVYNMTNLKELSLINIENVNTQNVYEMTNLEELRLVNCGITDTEGIEKLNKLKYLELSGNDIKTIDDVIKIETLTKLDLIDCGLTDIKGIETLDKLTYLELSGNDIKTIDDIVKLKELTSLYLVDCGITDISQIKNLLKLQSLDLGSNKIGKIDSILELENLHHMMLNNCDLTDISGIERLNNLTRVELGYNNIKDISSLEKLNNLTHVYIEYNWLDITENSNTMKVINSLLDRYVNVAYKNQMEGIIEEGGDATESNPLVLSVQKEEAVDKLINELDNSFEYNIVGEPKIEGDYKIYKVKLDSKSKSIQEELKNTPDSKYIEIKAELKNDSIISKLDKILIKDDEGSGGGGTPPTPPSPDPIEFKDIKDHWAEETIKLFVDKGFIEGYEDDTFRPNNSMTRAEFVKVVNKVFGYTKKGSEQFIDVDTNDWFYEEICIGINQGYIQGKSKDIFAPNDNITRQEVAMILTNIMKNKDENLDKLNQYKDGNETSKWAESSVEGAIEAGYLKGYDNNTIRSMGDITRAEAITMLNRVKK